LANILEITGWTNFIARLSAPLTRLGHLGRLGSASFAVAFFSPSTSNALLAEGHAQGKISWRELIFSNIFASFAAFFVHLPSLAALALAFLGTTGLCYIGICLAAAVLKIMLTALCGRVLLPAPGNRHEICPPEHADKSFQTLRVKIWKRFKARFFKMIMFTVPIYVLFFVIHKLGWFAALQSLLTANTALKSLIRPEALSIVVLHIAAEAGAAFPAASSLAVSGSLSPSEIILALLIGSILSTPIRAFRHQLPAYAGYFTPGAALSLLGINQVLRAFCMLLLTIVYYYAYF